MEKTLMTITKECHNELLVSVVLPVYNGEKHLSRSIESVLSQCVHFELIIVNDASTDNSISIIEKYMKEEQIEMPAFRLYFHRDFYSN